LTDQEFSIF